MQLTSKSRLAAYKSVYDTEEEDENQSILPWGIAGVAVIAIVLFFIF